MLVEEIDADRVVVAVSYIGACVRERRGCTRGAGEMTARIMSTCQRAEWGWCHLFGFLGGATETGLCAVAWRV
jgi:hypothetical protein